MKKFIIALAWIFFASIGSADTIAISDSNIYWDPYIWQSVGGGALTSNNIASGATSIISDAYGAGFRTGFNGTSLVATCSSGTTGTAVVSVDNHTQSVVTLGTGSVTLATGQPNGSHQFWFKIQSGNATITSFTTDSGGTMLPPAGANAIRSLNIIAFGDSIMAGGLTDGVNFQAQLSFINPVAEALNANLGQIAYSGQGYEVAGSAFASLLSAYTFHTTGVSRLVGGLLVPQPDYILVQHGVNGTTTSIDVSTLMAGLRTIAPNAKILSVIPFGQYASAAISSGTSGSRVFLINCGVPASIGLTSGSGPSQYSSDGTHPLYAREGLLGAAMTSAIAPALLGGTSVLNATTLHIGP